MIHSKFTEICSTPWLAIATTPPVFFKKLQKFHPLSTNSNLLIKMFRKIHPLFQLPSFMNKLTKRSWKCHDGVMFNKVQPFRCWFLHLLLYSGSLNMLEWSSEVHLGTLKQRALQQKLTKNFPEKSFFKLFQSTPS